MNDDAIRELFGQVPYFVDQIIEKYEPLDEIVRQFITSSYWSDQASINIIDVCGTAHSDYAGMTWREFLSKGRRMEGNIGAFKRNPNYYTDAAIKRLPSMHFLRQGSKTFIGEDGNHRTCIGKLYLYSLGHAYIHQVTLIENSIDWPFYELYRRLDAVAGEKWHISARRESTRREDGPGWKRDFFETNVQVVDRAQRSQWSWNREQLDAELPELEAVSRKSHRNTLLSRLFRCRRSAQEPI